MRSGLLRWLGFGAILLLVLPILAACGGEDGEADPAPASAESSSGAESADVDLAPEFGSIDNWYNGSATTLAELRGEPVLLVFWADY